MSGIAGVVYPDLFHIHRVLDPMLNLLSQRGAQLNEELVRDAYSYKNISIGVSGGPLSANVDKSLLAAMDGSIFNYQTLAKDLEEEGYDMTTYSHSELILHAYDAWGEKFAEKIEGDFAAVVFDRKIQTIFLFRDRVGVKPLYWFFDQNHFIFASEIKAMLASGLIPQAPAKDAIAIYLALGYIPQDMAPIENINKLLPAHYLKFSLEKGMTIHSYWSYAENFHKNPSEPIDIIHGNLDNLLKASVKKRLVPHMTPGCFLSGGIGSATIASYLRRERPYEDIPAFTVGFQEENDADIMASSGFAQALHLNQTIGIITPKTLLDDFVKIIWHLDEPLADPIAISTYNLAKIASTQSRYVYSGMGSDELLAGHGRYTLAEQESPMHYNVLFYWHNFLRLIIVPLLQWIKPQAAFNLLKHAQPDIWQVGYIRHNSLFSEQLFNEAAPSLKGFFNPEVFVHKFHNLSKIDSHTSSFLYLDFKTRLPDLYIAQYEKLTMANGLDWRAPFLDPPIIEYLAGFPEPSSLKEKDTASILKTMLVDIFPKELIYRTKKTRTQLLSSWIEKGDLFTLFQYLRKGSLVESGIIDENWILKATADPGTCVSYFRNLWALLALEVWFRLFINFPIEKSRPEISLQDLLTKS